ncbi:MAG: hypothetical protein WB783_04100 [Arenicellales bacterium]
MIDRWREFLETEGLSAGPDGYSHTDTENVDAFQKLTGDTLCDLGHEAVVRASGHDAHDFLQNQLTCDLRSLDAEQSVLGGYCDPKGRLICVLRVSLDGDGLLLKLPLDLRDTVLERLRRYVLRAKVDFSTDERTAFGMCGKTAARGLEGICGPLPAGDSRVTHAGDLAVTRLGGDGRPRFEVTGPAESCIAAWSKLARHATVVGSWTWARLDILAGVPNITPATSGSFIPQMVNLDLLGGVSFQKGCYPGQEIVARMHYLGNLKQRMTRFRIGDEDRPRPGDRVYTQGHPAPTGTVVDAQPGPGAGWDLLAVVRIADVGRHPLCLKSDRGPVLFEQELPYTVFEPNRVQSR